MCMCARVCVSLCMRVYVCLFACACMPSAAKDSRQVRSLKTSLSQVRLASVCMSGIQVEEKENTLFDQEHVRCLRYRYKKERRLFAVMGSCGAWFYELLLTLNGSFPSFVFAREICSCSVELLLLRL